MTALPEAKLAREAELCYALLAAVTDYDAWHNEHEAVDAATVFAVLQQNVEAGRAAVRQVVKAMPLPGRCRCRETLDSAVVTSAEHVPAETLERLGPILGRRMGTQTG